MLQECFLGTQCQVYLFLVQMASLHPDMHTETLVYITINVTIGIIHTVVHYMYKLEWEPVVIYGMVCLCEGGKQH